jgi:hypothetical protein
VIDPSFTAERFVQIPAQGVPAGTLKSHYIQFYPRNVPLEHLPDSYGGGSNKEWSKQLKVDGNEAGDQKAYEIMKTTEPLQ